MAKTRAKKSTGGTPADVQPGWRNRILGHGEVAPDQLLANEANWRIHPQTQQQALTGVLDEVGIVQSVIVNRRLGADWPAGKRGVETLVDGHMRAEVAISKGQPTIPVIYVDLSPAEEALVLASIDPISGMAVADPAKLDELLRDVSTGSAALQAMLDELATKAGLYQEETEEEAGGDDAGEEEAQGVVISFQLVFDDTDQQQVWFGFMRGLRAKFPDLQTHAARIVAFIEQSDLGGEFGGVQ